MTQVTGDADALRLQGRAWGAQAQAAETQVRQLRHTATTIGVAHFAGGAGDRMRNYIGQLTTATSAMAMAYDQIAVAAPRVADAIEQAKDAEKKRDDVQHEMDAKSHELDSATGDLLVARIAASVPGGSGSHADVAQAQARVDRLTDLVNRLRGKLNNAQTAFEDADRRRDRLSRAFADLCRRQSKTVTQSLPTVPPPPGIVGVLNKGGLAKGFLKAPLDLQVNAITKFYENRVAAGTASAVDKAALAKLSKWAGRLEKVNTASGVVLPLITSSITAFSNPNLSARQRQEYIVKHTAAQSIGGIAGGIGGAAACDATVILAPVSPVCALGGGIAGGWLAEQAAKSKAVTAASNFVSDNVVQPFMDGPTKLVHAHSAADVARAGLDMATASERATQNVVSETAKGGAYLLTHPKQVLHAVGDVAQDAAKVLPLAPILSSLPGL